MAEDETQTDYDDSAVGPGAPTPITALEVSSLGLHSLFC